MFLWLYKVIGDSMAPSFRAGDCLVVSASAYRRQQPGRGDIVIALDPRDSERHSLKRIVALPGEEVRFSEGLLYINGQHLAEPYLGGLPATLGLDESMWQLGERQFFVMGDNRAHSTDSRHYGPVDLELVEGKAVFRLWPLRRMGLISARRSA